MFEIKNKKRHSSSSVTHLITDYRLLITAMLLPAVLLSGCMGIYEGGFECPAGVGVGCKSISDVNTLVNLGEIPKSQTEQTTVTKPEIWYAPSMRYGRDKASCPSKIEPEHSLETQKSKVENVPISI